MSIEVKTVPEAWQKARQLELDARKADDAFQHELERVYGKKAAGDARYKFKHDDEAVQAAGLAYIAASNRWQEAVHAARLST